MPKSPSALSVTQGFCLNFCSHRNPAVCLVLWKNVFVAESGNVAYWEADDSHSGLSLLCFAGHALLLVCSAGSKQFFITGRTSAPSLQSLTLSSCLPSFTRCYILSMCSGEQDPSLALSFPWAVRSTLLYPLQNVQQQVESRGSCEPAALNVKLVGQRPSEVHNHTMQPEAGMLPQSFLMAGS